MTLTIVTVTLNDAEGLKKTLSSLIAFADLGIDGTSPQKLKWEILVIDSSPDVSLSVINEYSKVLPIKHFVVPAEGIYSAFNEGVGRSSGELIWFLNGGDLLCSAQTLAKVVGKFSDDMQLDLVVASSKLSRSGRVTRIQAPFKHFLFSIIGSNRVCHQAIVYRKASLLKVGLFSSDFKIAGDYLHHFSCYLAGFKTERVLSVLVDYDIEGSSSDYKKSFSEFKLVHRIVSARLSTSLNVINEIVRSVDYFRVASVKYIARFSFGRKIRGFWNLLQRKFN